MMETNIRVDVKNTSKMHSLIWLTKNYFNERIQQNFPFSILDIHSSHRFYYFLLCKISCLIFECCCIFFLLIYIAQQNRNAILIESSSSPIVTLFERLYLLRNFICTFHPLEKSPPSSWLLCGLPKQTGSELRSLLHKYTVSALSSSRSSSWSWEWQET